MTKQPKKHNECCDAMALVLEHTHSVTKKVGIQREMFLNFRDGGTNYRLVVHFPKLKVRDQTEFPQHRNTAWAELNYCPFCGKKQKVQEAPKLRTSH